MSKAILVMDMPKSCMKCSLGQDTSCLLETAVFCSITRMYVFGKECESRPNWCPLKEVPQKKEDKSLKVVPTVSSQHTDYAKGYNACIDEIIGGAE